MRWNIDRFWFWDTENTIKAFVLSIDEISGIVLYDEDIDIHQRRFCNLKSPCLDSQVGG